MNSQDVYIVGIGSSAVGRLPDRTFTELCRDALVATTADAGHEGAPLPVTAVWFSNFMMDSWGQRAQRGQESLLPLIDGGLIEQGASIVNVEGGCASASVAFTGALTHVMSGRGEIALAIGVEKMNSVSSDPRERTRFLADGLAAAQGTQNDEFFWAPYRQLADRLGIDFAPRPDRSFAMDIYALWTQSHMAAYGTTAEHLALVAAKNHTNSVLNPRAQYRFAMTPAEVLADRVVAEPLTRAMCAPGTDGAAAVLVCSEGYLASLPARVRDRAVRVLGHATAGGIRLAGWEDQRAPLRASGEAYRQAGLTAQDLDVVELHDAAAFAEIHLAEDLGLCARGEGGAFAASGASQRDGSIPINPSGGLLSRGHPIGATGILMLQEIVGQLRGEAGDYQIPNARVGLAENGGGFAGNDVAVCAVTILAV